MAEVNWRRTFAISSLIFAFMLVCGSIYLHLRQKHHLGRLRHNDNIVAYSGVSAAAAPATTAGNFMDSIVNDGHQFGGDIGVEERPTTMRLKTPTDYFNQYYYTEEQYEENYENYNSDQEDDQDIERDEDNSYETTKIINFGSYKMPRQLDNCLHCICHTVTECKKTNLGIFRISRPYWIDAGELSVSLNSEENYNHNDDRNDKYLRCVNNAKCAAETVDRYITRYEKDCNGDGIIDCADFVALHLLGPMGCLSEVPPPFSARFQECSSIFKWNQ